jgi:hypothetical protein
VGGTKLGEPGPLFHLLPQTVALILTHVSRDSASLFAGSANFSGPGEEAGSRRRTYLDLTLAFATAVFEVKESGNPYTTSIQGMQVLLTLLENVDCKGLVDRIIKYPIELMYQQKSPHAFEQMIVQTILLCFHANAESTLKNLEEHYLEFFGLMFRNMAIFHSRSELRRAIFGLCSLIRMPNQVLVKPKYDEIGHWLAQCAIKCHQIRQQAIDNPK